MINFILKFISKNHKQIITMSSVKNNDYWFIEITTKFNRLCRQCTILARHLIEYFDDYKSFESIQDSINCIQEQYMFFIYLI